MIMLDIEDLVPETHLLRKIKDKIDFDFIYEEAESYYSQTGHPSIDPVGIRGDRGKRRVVRSRKRVLAELGRSNHAGRKKYR